MECPQCTTKTGVVDSRPTEDNYVYRRRKCKNCKWKFSTIELPIQKIEDIYLTSLSPENLDALTKLKDEIQSVIDGKKICT